MDRATAAQVYTPPAVEALAAFPIEAEPPVLVVMNENVTFRVNDRRDGSSYVLRLHRPGYHDLAELNAERVWLRALGLAGIAVPSAVPASDGRDYVPVAVPAIDETRYAGLTRWIEGEIVAEVLQRTEDGRVVEQYFAQLGSIMASMHNQASGWRSPRSFTRHAFDADGLMGDDPFWGRFWEHDALSGDERRVLLTTRDVIHGVLERYGREPATFSMIHADLHHYNVLVDGEQLSVIDFDDAGFGWHQYDIAVALYHSQATPNFDAIKRAFVAGYRATRAISDEALALVPMFQLIRGMAIIGWKHLRPEVEWPDGRFEQIKAGVLSGCATFTPPA
jgi:Ser/Thr protein kinase RdoA (MazF antagonist)